MSKRVTAEERILIHRWKQEGVSNIEVARRLGMDKSSIGRELTRNTGQRGYRPKQAQEKAASRARRPGRRSFSEAVRLDVDLHLREGWTPDIICHRARLDGRASVCKDTIYKYIYDDAKEGGELWKLLPRARRQRKRRRPRPDRRGQIPNQRRIDTRPAIVEKRVEKGHWEGDLVNGAGQTGHLVTLVERVTRFTLVGVSRTKEAGEVYTVICDLLERQPKGIRLSLTLDNGKEFSRHEEIAGRAGLDVYFAWPYHSWERGTNENTNGLIRRVHPKKSSFRGIGDVELVHLDRYLNDRPRKCLGWQTPREAMDLFLARAA